MKRYFYRRGQRVAVTEVKDVLAVHIGEEARASEDRPDAGPREAQVGPPAAGPRAGERLLEIPEEEAGALADAGWIFVRPPTPLAGAARAGGDLPRDVDRASPVYQLENGHVLIGTHRLTVRFSPDLAPQEIRGILDEDGLTAVQARRSAKNEFEVVIPPGADLLEVADNLHESETTVFAEPIFVEVPAR